MLKLIENGWKLTQINGNSGVYVASRGGNHIIYVTNVLDELERKSETFHNKTAAMELATSFANELAYVS